jgi:flagellar basal-body rod protein FlgF
MKSLEIASIGLRDDIGRLRLLSHNVANVTTPGFKRQVQVRESFESHLAGGAAGTTAQTHVDLTNGKLRATGGALDIALRDRDFVVVHGADGGLALSRAGTLQLDAQGRLTTAEGHLVAESRGALTVPAASTSVRIDERGQLMSDDRVLGTLRVVSVPTGDRVVALGDGLYGVNDVAALRASDAGVQAGHVEVSNVVPSQEMVHLMSTVRHAEAMVKLIQGSDEMLEKAIRKLGELS